MSKSLYLLIAPTDPHWVPLVSGDQNFLAAAKPVSMTYSFAQPAVRLDCILCYVKTSHIHS